MYYSIEALHDRTTIRCVIVQGVESRSTLRSALVQCSDAATDHRCVYRRMWAICPLNGHFDAIIKEYARIDDIPEW